MTDVTERAAPPVDPYADAPAASPARFLYRLNPLAKLAGPAPAMILLVFVRDAATPLAFLALAYAILLVGVRFTRRLALMLFVAVPLGVAALGWGSRCGPTRRASTRASSSSRWILDPVRRDAADRVRHRAAARRDRRPVAHRRAQHDRS